MRWMVLAACLLAAGCAPRGFAMAPGQAVWGPPPYPVYQAPMAPIPQFGPGRPTTTNCHRFGNAVNCSTY